MGKVILVISMSLDGFITAANRRAEEPMGDGGERHRPPGRSALRCGRIPPAERVPRKSGFPKAPVYVRLALWALRRREEARQDYATVQELLGSAPGGEPAH